MASAASAAQRTATTRQRAEFALSDTTMSANRYQCRSRPSSLNLDAKITIPPSRSVSFHGSSNSNGSVPGASSQYWRQQQLHRSQSGLRRQSSYSRRGQSSSASQRSVLMMKLLNDGMQWNGTIYRNNVGRWRDSWTLLDNPILMLNASTTAAGGSSGSCSSGDVEDEGFYGSCCLGDYADVNGKSSYWSVAVVGTRITASLPVHVTEYSSLNVAMKPIDQLATLRNVFFPLPHKPCSHRFRYRLKVA